MICEREAEEPNSKLENENIEGGKSEPNLHRPFELRGQQARENRVFEPSQAVYLSYLSGAATVKSN